MNRTVFVLPGGGLRGLIQANALAVIEQRMGMPISKIAHLLFCSSAGAVIGGSLVAGVEASVLANLLYDKASTYFPPYSKLAMFWRLVIQRKAALFDRNVILDDMAAHGADIKLGEALCDYAVCSVNTNTNLPRFFKSYSVADKERKLLDVVANSFAAPYYFGMRNDDADQVTYSDPGTGVENNPVLTAFIEVLANKWYKEGKVTIHVIGTGGGAGLGTSYGETRKRGLIKQAIAVFMLGSSQSETVNVKQAQFLDTVFENIDVVVHNPVLDASTTGFANLSAKDFYKNTGIAMGNAIDLSTLTTKA